MTRATRPIKALLVDADGVVQYPRHGWLREMARLGGPGFFVRATMVERRTLTGEADLRPLMLDDLGFNAAIGWLARDTSQRMGIEVTVSLDEADPRLDERA